MASPERVHGIPTDKSLLQEYAQRASVQLPVYQTTNEGPKHELQFKSQVLLDGEWYRSPNAFPNKKMAEQDAAKHAFIGFREKLKTEGRSLILEDMYLCKVIMHEYAVKMNATTPSYVTNELKACVPIFVSSLQLNGVSFTGDAARTRKEAELFAARSAILSILDSEAGTTMSEILRSKHKFFNAIKQAKDTSGIQVSRVMDSSSIQASPAMHSFSVPASTVEDSSNTACILTVSSNIPACIGKDSFGKPTCIVKDASVKPSCVAKDPGSMQACIVKDSPNINLGHVGAEVAPLDSALASFTPAKEVDVGVRAIKDTLAKIPFTSFATFPSLQLVLSKSASEQHSSESTYQSLHVFKKPNPISSVEAVTPPIVFVPPTIEQASESPPVSSTSGKKRRKNKKARPDVLYQSPSTFAMLPQNQVPAFSATSQRSGLVPQNQVPAFSATSQRSGLVPQNQVPTFAATSQQSGCSASMQGYVT